LSAFCIGFRRELSVNDLEKLLADDRPEPPRSRLEPHLDFVRELRRRGRTFRRIAKMLEEKCGVKVAPGTIHAFLTAKKRRRQPPPQPKRPDVEPRIDLEREFAPPPAKLSDDERQAALAKIREARRTYQKETSTELPTFTHSDEPLIFDSDPNQEQEK
jgi:hypothetical protein